MSLDQVWDESQPFVERACFGIFLPEILLQVWAQKLLVDSVSASLLRYSTIRFGMARAWLSRAEQLSRRFDREPEFRAEYTIRAGKTAW